MGILDFFRNRQKKDDTSLIVKDGSSIMPYTPKKKKIRNIVDFVENALISNGGNYEDIHQKLLAISEFAKNAKDYGVQCDFGMIDETLRDFFTEQPDIKLFPLKDNPHTAFYAKKDGWNFYNYRGVTIQKDKRASKPILYFGRRHERSETHRKDTIFCFADDIILFRDEQQARYDEIPLYGCGTNAEFYFDDKNQIIKVKFQYMTQPRLGFWSREQVCEFDEESGQYKLLPIQIPERTYNDPKPSDKSIKNCANFIVNMFDNTKDENTLIK